MDAPALPPDAPADAPASPNARRARRALGVTLVVYAVLVGLHLGEFWPFSIYPMFSRAGQPWRRTLVRELGPAETVAWGTAFEGDLPGRAYPLLPNGVEPIDLSDLLNSTTRWDAGRTRALQALFRDAEGRRLLIVRAEGTVEAGDSIAVAYTPYALVTGDSVRLAPNLPR